VTGIKSQMIGYESGNFNNVDLAFSSSNMGSNDKKLSDMGVNG